MPAPAPSSPAPFARVQDWFRAHRGLVDAFLALGLWVLFGFVTAVSSMDGREAFWMVTVTTVQLLPLAWRRTRPEISFGIIAAGHLLQLLVASDPLPSNVSALMSAYAVAAYSRHRRVRQVALVAATVAGPLAIIDWDGYEDTPLTALVFSALMYSGLALVCWLWGDLTRKRRELVSRLQEQNDALRRDRDQRARLAAQDERTRIAREMHDIVAHSLSVVVVQSDGAAYSATHSPDFDREQARAALTTIGTTAREALAETRRLVGVLRTEGEGGDPGLDYAPTEGLPELPHLVERVAATGIDVRLEGSPDPATVPREVGLAAYRIVQESLTNVIKHAGPGARVRVLLEVARGLQVQVRDDGRGAAASDDGNGHGLIGMRERAVSVGGTMTAGPASGGGYLVTAALPFDHEVPR